MANLLPAYLANYVGHALHWREGASYNTTPRYFVHADPMSEAMGLVQQVCDKA
jgi:hypothetical protein